MSDQYDFQLVFLRLLLKHKCQSDSKLTITLMQNNQPIDTTSTFPENQNWDIKKDEKIVDLDSVKIFRFHIKQSQLDNSLALKYEIKGTREQRVRIIPIDVQKMIDEYRQTKRIVFQQSYADQNAEIFYKLCLTCNKTAKELDIPTESNEKDQEGFGNRTKRSNSISRTKRPPSLNISKRTSPLKIQVIQPPPRQTFPMNPQDSRLSFTELAANKLPYLTLNNAESKVDYSFETHNKISSLPLSEIQKIKEIKRKHEASSAILPHHYVSLKMKLVVGLLLIGIMFLLFDTISGRKLKKRISKNQQNYHRLQNNNFYEQSESRNHQVTLRKGKNRNRNSTHKAFTRQPHRHKQ